MLPFGLGGGVHVVPWDYHPLLLSWILSLDLNESLNGMGFMSLISESDVTIWLRLERCKAC